MRKLLSLLIVLLLLSAGVSAAAEGAQETRRQNPERQISQVSERPEGKIRKEVDEENKLVLYSPGEGETAFIECQYEGKGTNPVKIRYLDGNMERVENPYGYSVVKLEYDNRNRVSKATFYGTNGRLRDNSYGYAHIYLRYADNGLSYIIPYNSRGTRLPDRDGSIFRSVSSWATQEGKPLIQGTNLSLSMNWEDPDPSLITLSPQELETPTPAPTNTPTPTGTPEPTGTPAPTKTPAPTATNTPTPSNTPTPKPTETPTPAPTDTPTPRPTETPAPTPIPTPTLTPTPVILHTVEWETESGIRLDRKTYAEGEKEPATRITPAKQMDEENTYTFAGWVLA